MDCPRCSEKMRLYKEEACFNSQDGKRYKRTQYHCQRDNVWGRLEAPDDGASTSPETLAKSRQWDR
jgi:hypothetical protein